MAFMPTTRFDEAALTGTASWQRRFAATTGADCAALEAEFHATGPAADADLADEYAHARDLAEDNHVNGY